MLETTSHAVLPKTNLGTNFCRMIGATSSPIATRCRTALWRSQGYRHLCLTAATCCASWFDHNYDVLRFEPDGEDSQLNSGELPTEDTMRFRRAHQIGNARQPQKHRRYRLRFLNELRRDQTASPRSLLPECVDPALPRTSRAAAIRRRRSRPAGSDGKSSGNAVARAAISGLIW